MSRLARTWAADHIAALARGETVSFRPVGGSMTGRIESGQLVTVSPEWAPLSIGDIVLVTIGASVYVHLVLGIEVDCGTWRWLIGNNKGRINGWVTREAVHGKVIRVEA